MKYTKDCLSILFVVGLLGMLFEAYKESPAAVPFGAMWVLSLVGIWMIERSSKTDYKHDH